MAVRRATKLGDPRLKAVNKEVLDFKNTKVTKVISDLVDTMHKLDLIGMAAPQIGENWKIFVTEPRKTTARPGDQSDELRIYINPKVVFESTEKSVIYEGCGSVPGNIFGPVERPRLVTVEAFNQNGEIFTMKADGLLGRVIQHEIDHLNGIEFLEKVIESKNLLSRKFYIKNIKYSLSQTEASKISVKEYNLGKYRL